MYAPAGSWSSRPALATANPWRFRAGPAQRRPFFYRARNDLLAAAEVLGRIPMRMSFSMRLGLILLTSVVAGTSASSAWADVNTTCEAYANRSMVQIQKAEKYPSCRQQGWFAGDRWRKDWNYHFNECAKRYDIKTKAHTTFTQAERKTRDGQLSSCVIKFF
jgi:hypothetical protein